MLAAAGVNVTPALVNVVKSAGFIVGNIVASCACDILLEAIKLFTLVTSLTLHAACSCVATVGLILDGVAPTKLTPELTNSFKLSAVIVGYNFCNAA